MTIRENDYQRPEMARIDYEYRPARLVCPCGVSRPEGFFQSDPDGTATGPFDRLSSVITCAMCGRVMTIEGVVIARREAETA